MRSKILVFFLLVSVASVGQRFIYDVDFVTYFDNREYHNPYEVSSTLFGMRLTPVVGVELTDREGGVHALRGGLSYIQPFGAEMRSGKLFPTIYYDYAFRGYSVNLGTIPYTGLWEDLPLFLMNDSLRFAYPNIQGALLGYSSERGYVQFFCDWRGMQSKTTREAFRLVLLGRYAYDWFYVGGYGAMNHLANKALSEPNLGVCDDVMINPYVGVNLSDYTPLDTFSVRVGYLGGYYTDRKVGAMSVRSGFLCDFFVRWRFLGLKNSLYVGQGQMPYYEKYGSELYQGSALYQSGLYNRTDVMVYLIRRSFVNCYFSWNFHVLKGYGLSNEQQLVLRFNLDGLKRKEKLRNLSNQ